ncbi:hypothetical protein KY285_020602 [Solanum tuberosum]|nr:hypothetical protein KY285_020602 [Solanum tuberosum]
MLFHKIALELGVENVETFECKVNKNGDYYMLNIDSNVFNLLNGLKGADFVDVYVVHPISIPLVVEEILLLPITNANVSSSPQKDNDDVFSSPHKNRDDLSSFPQIDRIDVSSSQPFDENENRHLNQNQSPIVEEQFPRVEKHAPRVEEHSDSDSDSLYDIDKNIDNLSDLDEELLQARQSNIQEQVKEKVDRVNLDEISSDDVGIDSDFEDIYKNKRGRFEGNLGGDDPYFDSSDPGSDISEDEGDPVENDKVVDPLPRNKSTKIYFDPTAKKKNVGTSYARTSNAGISTAGTSAANTGTSPSVALALTLARRPTNASSSDVRPVPTLASAGRPISATSDVMPATTSTFCGMPTTTPLSTQQLTSSAVDHKRKTSTTLRGGATLGYKRPRQKKKQRQLVMVSYLDQVAV